MSNPYTNQSASNYNASPPPDDGSQTTSNLITWAGIKTKLVDPVKALADAINTAAFNAFAVVARTDQANTFSGNNTFSGANTFSGSNTFTADQTIQSTDGGATAAPSLSLYRNSPSPAVNDVLGNYQWTGNNLSAGTLTYAALQATMLDANAGSEDGRLDFLTTVGGTNSQRMFLGAGLFMQGATGTDKGAGTVNATALYQNGTAVSSGLAKAWVVFNGTTVGSITKADGFNVSGTITRNTTGDYTVTWSTPFSSANYTVSFGGQRTTASDPLFITITSIAAGSLRFVTRQSNGTAEDYPLITVVCHGTQ